MAGSMAASSPVDNAIPLVLFLSLASEKPSLQLQVYRWSLGPQRIKGEEWLRSLQNAPCNRGRETTPERQATLSNKNASAKTSESEEGA